MPPSAPDPEFESLLIYLRQNRGFDFTGYKRSTLMRRVLKRIQSLDLATITDYVDHLEVYPEEFNYLFNTILINVTAFFRDPSAWAKLCMEVLPQLITQKGKTEPIRIWSAGCASGEEAYTLAIVMAELMGAEDFRQRVKIYATDVDEEALNEARQASYMARDIEDVPDAYREQYFESIGNRFIFRHDLRRSVIFGRHDLLQDAPISRLDLLVCRNTLMYFNSEAQSRVLTRFHFALNETGYLFLGKAEMLLTHTNLFSPIDLKCRIFTKIPAPNLRERLLVINPNGNEESSSRLARLVRLRESAFDVAPVAQIVVDRQGIVLMLNQEARNLFGLTLRDLGRPFYELEVSYRPAELRSPIERAYAERNTVTLENVERHVSKESVQYCKIQIVPLQDSSNNLLGVNISFDDVTPYNLLQQDLNRSHQELETTTEELQSTNEELETTNEELQSTNEELETTNEELQSTNEELETMNEELQSTNEELQTINSELGERTTELHRSNTFLSSIIAGLQAGIVVVDTEFAILIWNHIVEDMWGLRSDEVVGHSLFSLDIGLPIEQLRSPIRAILSGQQDSAEQLLPALNRRGKSIRCLIRFTPLASDQIEGVIIRMIDLEAFNTASAGVEMREREE